MEGATHAHLHPTWLWLVPSPGSAPKHNFLLKLKHTWAEAVLAQRVESLPFTWETQL